MSSGAKTLLGVAALLTLAGAAPKDESPFVERFPGPLDHERWDVSDGWTNGDWMGAHWAASQVRPAGGMLELVVANNARAPKGVFAGEMQSNAYYRYGYYETRMRAAKGDGLVSAFFTYTNPDQGGTSNEIDIEFVGADPSLIQLTYHVGPKASETVKKPLGFDASAAFHNYAFEWRPTYVRWFVDGRLIHEERGTASMPLPTRAQKIFVSLWNGNGLDNWTGRFNRAGAPYEALYSCIAFSATLPAKPLC